MNEWLVAQGITTPQMGFVAGLSAGLFALLLVAWWQSRRNAVLQTRLSDRDEHYLEEIEHLASRIFEERSERLAVLNSRQLDGLLRPLGEKLTEFRNSVENAHRAETAQHEVMKEKIGDLEKLNERLHDDATRLSSALTANVKAQGNWGEQQLGRLLELSGLREGREYSVQVAVTADDGRRLQPDVVMHLPQGKSIVLDAKVSLLAWSRYQSAATDSGREAELAAHIQSLRQHIRGLAEKRYSDVAELDALDFVLMFVPLEAALIAALQADDDLAAFALEHRIALVAPTNFLATVRTVAAVWSAHRQSRNAREIASRAGLLYDKFSGFVDNLQQVGSRLRQAQQSYEAALGQLASGSGNLVRQAEQLRELGARNSRQLDATLVERAEESELHRSGLDK